jgi:hypothetical protein
MIRTPTLDGLDKAKNERRDGSQSMNRRNVGGEENERPDFGFMAIDDDDSPQGLPLDDENELTMDHHHRRRSSINLSLSRHTEDDEGGRQPEDLDLGLGVNNLNDTPTSRSTVVMNASRTDLDDTTFFHRQDDSPEVPSSGEKRKAKGTKQQNRRPIKRRKILTDGEQTVLTDDEVRQMLADTQDIVRTNLDNPAAWNNTASNEEETNTTSTTIPSNVSTSMYPTNRELIFTNLKYEQLFARPALGDDGLLAPILLQLCEENMAPIFGKVFPYVLIQEEDDEEEEEEELLDQPPPQHDANVPMKNNNKDESPASSKRTESTMSSPPSHKAAATVATTTTTMTTNDPVDEEEELTTEVTRQNRKNVNRMEDDDEHHFPVHLDEDDISPHHHHQHQPEDSSPTTPMHDTTSNKKYDNNNNNMFLMEDGARMMHPDDEDLLLRQKTSTGSKFTMYDTVTQCHRCMPHDIFFAFSLVVMSLVFFLCRSE